MRKHLRKRLVKASILLSLVIAALLIGSLLTSGDPLGKADLTIGSIPPVTIGTPLYAAEDPDYTCDGTDDNVQFQAALNALPSGGGKVRVLGGTYSFTSQVTRAIDNITIEGLGESTYIELNDVTPVFSAGAQSGWVFKDFSTDVGGLDVSTATNWLYSNIKEGTTYYAVRGSAALASLPNTGLYLLDTNASHSLVIQPGSNLTANRILTVTTGDAARTITLSGNPTLSDWFDQSVKTTANPTFGNLTITSFAAGWTNAGNTIANLGSVTTADINGGTIGGVSFDAASTVTAGGITLNDNQTISFGTAGGEGALSSNGSYVFLDMPNSVYLRVDRNDGGDVIVGAQAGSRHIALQNSDGASNASLITANNLNLRLAADEGSGDSYVWIDNSELQLDEVNAPGAGAANTVRIYAVEGGDTLTDLSAVFQDGTVAIFVEESTQPGDAIVAAPSGTQWYGYINRPNPGVVEIVAVVPGYGNIVLRRVEFHNEDKISWVQGAEGALPAGWYVETGSEMQARMDCTRGWNRDTKVCTSSQQVQGEVK